MVGGDVARGLGAGSSDCDAAIPDANTSRKLARDVDNGRGRGDAGRTAAISGDVAAVRGRDVYVCAWVRVGEEEV